MGADANIFQSFTQPVRSVSDYMGDADLRDLRRTQLMGATQTNALQALTMDQTRQTMADTQRRQNALRAAGQSAGPNADPVQFANTLLRNPDTMDAGVALQKHLVDTSKVQADTAESTAKASKATQEAATGAYELRVKKADQAFKDISAFDSPEQAMASLNQHTQAGDIDFQKSNAIALQLKAIPPGDRIAFQKWQTGMLQAILSAKEKLAETAPKPTEVRLGDRVAFIDMNPQSQTFKQEVSSARVGVSPDTVANNATSRANNRDTLAQGERLAANAVTYQTDGNGNLVAVPTKAPAGSVIKAKSVVAPGPGMVPLPGAGGKMTEDQGKATGWLIQAENAFKNMKAAIDPVTGTPSAAKPGFNDALAGIPSFGLTEGLANSMRGKDRQKFMQGASSLSESLLRAATGAGVNHDEAVQKIKELTPVFGEAQETTDQKMIAIPLYIESLKVRAGPGAKKAAEVLGSGKSGKVINFGDLK